MKSPTKRSGTILIVTMVVSFALAGTVLVLCRSMRVEMQTTANMAAAAEAAAVERGAEQYVVAMLAQDSETIRDLAEDQFTAIPVGEGFFWILRPDYGDPALPAYGLTEESAKLNINSASFDQLSRLPGMTYTAASSIMDWKDDDTRLERDGAESEYYLSLPEPYYSKDANFETVEELLLVRGVDRLMLYGTGTGRPLGNRSSILDNDALGNDPALERGLFDLVTIYSLENNNSPENTSKLNMINRSTGSNRLRELLRRHLPTKVDSIISALGRDQIRNIQDFYRRGRLKPEDFAKIADYLSNQDSDRPVRGRINVNSAPRDVLLTLGIPEADVNQIIQSRSNTSSNSIAWLFDILKERAVPLVDLVTARSFQFSADILAVSGNGRAFKRCRIVVTTRSGTPRIIYRRDLSERGWPIETETLAALRAGQGPGRWANSVAYSQRGRL
jgi:general secretion pathway protein K